MRLSLESLDSTTFWVVYLKSVATNQNRMIEQTSYFSRTFFSDNSQTNSKCFVQSVTELKLRQMFFIETDAEIETKEGARDLIY